jgi:hypothetical protein
MTTPETACVDRRFASTSVSGCLTVTITATELRCKVPQPRPTFSTRASADSMTVKTPGRFLPSAGYAQVGVAVEAFLACFNLSGMASAQTKTFTDYIKPAPIVCSPLSSATWGVYGVVPRDICNGIESARGAAVPPEFYYWDGQILKAKDGKYHMFMSTWSGTAGFTPGWLNSDAYHAVSAQGVLGPYERQGYVYTENGSHKGRRYRARATGRQLRGRGQRDRRLHHLQVELPRRSLDGMCPCDPDQRCQLRNRRTLRLPSASSHATTANTKSCSATG